MPNNHINFTEKTLENLPIPVKGQSVYYDTGTCDGLCVIITYGGAKTYYAYMKFQGVPKRIKIGRIGQIKLYDARAKAHSLKEMSIKGQDPSQERRESQNDITLRQFYENVYRPEYSLSHKKPHSIENDDTILKYHLGEFHNRRLLTITQNEIQHLHNKTQRTHSNYTANRVLSLIKHIYNIAIKYGYIVGHENPAVGISKFPEKSRDRYLKPDEFGRFFDALNEEPNETFQNYILLSLFTGQRRGNILALRWSDVDFKNNIIYFPDSKNGDPITIPMTDQLRELLLKIKENKKSEWVLPSDRSNSGHFNSPKRSWQMLLNRAGIENLRLHDLRRTMGSYQAINGSSLNIIGKSLGHKSTSATQVYARLSIDPIRDSMQKATDKMMEFKSMN